MPNCLIRFIRTHYTDKMWRGTVIGLAITMYRTPNDASSSSSSS